MKLTGWLILSLAVLALGEGAWIYSQHQAARRMTAEVEAVLQANAELKGTVNALSQESQTHKALADQAGQTVEDQDKTIKEIKAKLARVQHVPGASQPPGPASPMDGGPVAGAPVDGSVDALKDQLIEALDTQNGALKVEVSELRQALTAQDGSLQASEDRAKKMEAVLVKVPAQLNRAFGVIYGPKTKGITAEMDMGPLRVGVDVVVRRPNETEAMARVLWRF